MTLFKLPVADKYVYRAVTSVLLPQVQHAVSMGGVNGLYAWYRDLSGQPVVKPFLVVLISDRLSNNVPHS